MAEKKSEGGGVTWLLAGFLLGVAVTLGGLAFLSHDPADAPVQAQSAIVAAPAAPQAPGAAQPSAPVAAQPQAKADVPTSTDPVKPSVSTPIPAQAADNLDPEVADDAASVGMTSRAPTR